MADFRCTHTLTTRKQDAGKTEAGNYQDKGLTSWKTKTNLCGIDKEAKTQYNKTKEGNRHENNLVHESKR